MFPPDDRIVDFFLEAYRHGAFPMAEPARPRSRRAHARRIDWFIPDPRAVIDLDAPPRSPQDLGGFHIPRSLARLLRSHPFLITSDTAFESVIRACAEPTTGREDSWLDERLIRAYTLLHARGHAHSVEVWLPTPSPATREGGGGSDLGGASHARIAGSASAPQDAPLSPTLVGGVYGVALGRVFCAESMFCRPALGGTNASKIALATLARHLHRQGFTLIDVQLRNHHTDQFGVIEIPSQDYLGRLATLAADPRPWGVLNPLSSHHPR